MENMIWTSFPSELDLGQVVRRARTLQSMARPYRSPRATNSSNDKSLLTRGSFRESAASSGASQFFVNPARYHRKDQEIESHDRD
jgi:hypothetical protein